MNKIIVSLMIIGIISILIAGYFIIFNNEKENPIKSNGKISDIEGIKISINGQESKSIEYKCNSSLIKCTKAGCEQIC